MSAPTQPTADGEAAKTPTPWKTSDIGDICGSVWSDRVDRLTQTLIANVTGASKEEATANLRHIVRAVNSHAALVAALSVLTLDPRISDYLATTDPKVFQQARAALKQAE